MDFVLWEQSEGEGLVDGTGPESGGAVSPVVAGVRGPILRPLRRGGYEDLGRGHAVKGGWKGPEARTLEFFL